MGLLKAWRVCFSSDRGFAVGIYTTNSPEACQYVADNCKANIIVVENHKQLQKILQVSPGIKDKDKDNKTPKKCCLWVKVSVV